MKASHPIAIAALTLLLAGSPEIALAQQPQAAADLPGAAALDTEIKRLANHEALPACDDPAALPFVGESLPTEWKPNWAGVIIGPVDRGISLAEDLRFYPGLVEGPAAPR